MSKELLFGDGYYHNDEARARALVEKYPTADKAIAYLKRNPHLGGLEASGGLGDWLKPEWLVTEREQRLHMIYSDGGGNDWFLSEKTGQVWEFIHDDPQPGEPNYGYFGPARFTWLSCKDSYQAFLESFKEDHLKDYVSPYEIQRPKPVVLSVPRKKIPMAQRIKAAKTKGLAFGVGYGIAGAGVGAFGGGLVGAAAMGAVMGTTMGAIGAASGFAMGENTMMEHADDPEIFFAIQEKGSHGHGNGKADVGVGDRALAGKTRICGQDQLIPMLRHLMDALRAGGWKDGAPLTVRITQGDHDGVNGREWSLRDAIAEAWVKAEVRPEGGEGQANPELAKGALFDSDLPDEAVTFGSLTCRHVGSAGWLTATLRYLSDGSAASGQEELMNAMRTAGFDIEGSA
jgi:hypothetical protein